MILNDNPARRLGWFFIPTDLRIPSTYLLGFILHPNLRAQDAITANHVENAKMIYNPQQQRGRAERGIRLIAVVSKVIANKLDLGIYFNQ